jgi:hypothetical protein
MSTLDTSQSPSPIQRLLIFHLNLAEKCLGGVSLGEGASIEELCENIVYYHREGEGINGVAGQKEETPCTEEAVQFLGLCTALLTLPSSLGDEELENDRTNEIYFGNSTLVFIPLESSPDLVAVAQISRLYQNGNKSDSGGGNPLAVRASVERCHDLFCMLHGGGVLHRLAAGTDKKEGIVGTCLYPGMDKLFKMQKELRKASKQLSKRGPTNNDRARSREIGDIQSEIKALRNSLPIQTIRRDLDAHYKQYLGDLSVVIGRNGGAARCMVETVPVPIPQDSDCHVVGSLASNVNSYVSVTLGLALRQMLCEFELKDENEPYLLGATTFHRGQLLYTHFLTEDSSKSRSGDSDSAQATFPKELACLLMAYMSSYRAKMKQLASTNRSTNQPGTPPRLGLKGLTLSFAPLADEAASIYREAEHATGHKHMEDTLGFLSPPPLYMFSSSDHSYCFEGPNQENIWAPKVHIPLMMSSDNTNNGTRYVDAHVISFQQEDFSFLFYVGCRITDEKVTPIPASILQRLGERIAGIISEDSAFETSSRPDQAPEYQGEAGQDIVHIDRDRHMLTLISDRKQVFFREKPKPTSTRSPPRRFLGFGPRATENKTNNTHQTAIGTLSEWSALGLDCRHLLASHLHLDTVLAFDDMMSEVAKTKRKVWKQENTTQNPIEFCTCMPLGWMYAFAEGEMELYAFFDSSIYVTVADVQGAASKLQGRFFGRWAEKSREQ